MMWKRTWDLRNSLGLFGGQSEFEGDEECGFTKTAELTRIFTWSSDGKLIGDD